MEIWVSPIVFHEKVSFLKVNLEKYIYYDVLTWKTISCCEQSQAKIFWYMGGENENFVCHANLYQEVFFF